MVFAYEHHKGQGPVMLECQPPQLAGALQVRCNVGSGTGLAVMRNVPAARV